MNVRVVGQGGLAVAVQTAVRAELGQHRSHRTAEQPLGAEPYQLVRGDEVTPILLPPEPARPFELDLGQLEPARLRMPEHVVTGRDQHERTARPVRHVAHVPALSARPFPTRTPRGRRPGRI